MCIAVHTVNKNMNQNKKPAWKNPILWLLSLFLLLQKKKALAPAIEEISPVTHNTVTIEVASLLHFPSLGCTLLSPFSVLHSP